MNLLLTAYLVQLRVMSFNLVSTLSFFNLFDPLNSEISIETLKGEVERILSEIPPKGSKQEEKSESPKKEEKRCLGLVPYVGTYNRWSSEKRRTDSIIQLVAR